MNINFEKEVLKRKNDLIKDLQELLRINTELKNLDLTSKTKPFGQGNRDALDWFLSWGQNNSFKTMDVEGYAGHLEYGNQDEFVAMIGHLDVVPATGQWTYPPYEAQIHHNRVYARGAEDDKGPTIAALYALKILKELNIPLSKRIKLIVGLDEESGFRCMKKYFENHPQQPTAGFIPDANFPLIYGEKGITRTLIKGLVNDQRIISLTGGSKDNMVSDSASITLANDNYQDNWDKYLLDNNLKGQAVVNDNTITLSVLGQSAHGAEPQNGVSAIDLLIKGLIKINFTNDLINFINQYLVDDFYGVNLGINYQDEQMGQLTNNFGVLSIVDNNFDINLNIRYPKGIDYFNTIIPTLKNKCEPLNYQVVVASHSNYLYQDPNGEMIQKLLKVYRKHTQDYSDPICIGGGTYARVCDNVVAFGPQFPGKPSYLHQIDESIDIDDLIKATIIYTESLYELAK